MGRFQDIIDRVLDVFRDVLVYVFEHAFAAANKVPELPVFIGTIFSLALQGFLLFAPRTAVRLVGQPRASQLFQFSFYFMLISVLLYAMRKEHECSNWIISRVRSISLGNNARRRIYHVCREFLVESSVLVFVFPVLDTVVNYGKAQVTASLVRGSFLISLVFFVGAIIMTLLSEE